MVLTDLAWRYVAVEDVGRVLEREAAEGLRTNRTWVREYLRLLAEVYRLGAAEGLAISPTSWGYDQLRERLRTVTRWGAAAARRR